MSDSVSNEETIFDVARQLSHPQDRAAYLDSACGDDKQLRDRINRLLAADVQANEFFRIGPFALREQFRSPWTQEQTNQTTCGDADAGAISPRMPITSPTPGEVIGDYEIIEQIGGNMGLVFKARHRLLNKVVALKVLSHDFIDPLRRARFERELRAMGQLEHPNLVKAVDARVIAERPLVAMEFIDGMDLERVLEQRGALSIGAACEAARQAAAALEYAHSRGLIHRDVKPANLMLTQTGTVKVIDMGLALIRDEVAPKVTKDGMVLGTMRYCAPEQLRDASRVDIRADIYSLGCTLYHLLAGTPPYSHRTTLAEVIHAHLHEEFPRLTAVRQEVPSELAQAIGRMTAKDPAARFSTPGEVVQALTPFARQEELKQLAGPKVEKVERPGVALTRGPGTDDAGGDYTAAGTARRKLAKMAALFGMLMGVGVLLFTTCDRPKNSTTSRAEAVTNSGESAGSRPADAINTNTVGQVTTHGANNRRVILMDTTAVKGIYDTNNIGRGRFNFDELYDVLKDDFPGGLVREAVVEYEWDRDETIAALRPDLVVIHRSLFYHPLAARMDWRYPPFDTAEKLEEWRARYQIADEKLIRFMGTVGRRVPHTQFLVYSRGTDQRWLDKPYRDRWLKDIERRFSELKGRIKVMVIPDGEKSTFRHPETAAQMRTNVLDILGLSDERER